MADELIAGRYRLFEEVGRGASAAVYRAEDTVLGRIVALKAVSASLLSDPSFMTRFNAEARLAAGLDHPGIVTVYDVGTFEDGRPFISMKLIEGEPLSAYMESRPSLSRRERVQVLAQVADALDYIHNRGLVHRDVKPANILVDAQGKATLMDFGIAVAIDTARVTLTGMTVGTPRYMSPEQVQGKESTRSTDIYALGVIAFEVLGGVPPYEGSGTSLMYRIVNENPRLLSTADSGIGEAAEAVVASALAKEPAQRWPTAGAFIQALLAAVPEGAPVPPLPAQPAPPARPSTPDDIDTQERLAALAAAPAAEQPAPPPTPVPSPDPVPPPPAPPPRPAPPVVEPAGAGSDGPGGRAARPAASDGGRNGPRRGVLLGIGGAVAVALGLVGGAAIFALNGGDGAGADPDDTPTATSEGPGAETPTPTRTQPGGNPTATNTPPLTATPTPTFRWSEITGVEVSGDFYVIEFITGNFEPSLPNAMHVHFFFDTVPPTEAGVPGDGPWHLYGGPSPYREYSLAETPPNATQMCILVANADHSVVQGTGNCVDLP